MGKPKSAFEQTEQVRTFLLLGISFTLDWTEEDRRLGRKPPSILSTIRALGGSVEPVLLLDNTRSIPPDVWRWHRHGRLLVRTGSTRNGVRVARRVAESIHSLLVVFGRLPLALIHHWAGTTGIRPYPIPERIIRRGQILFRAIEAIERKLNPYMGQFEQVGLRTELMGGGTNVGEQAMAHVFFHLPTVGATDALFEAAHLYQECASDFTFLGDEIREVLANPQAYPESEAERVELENVVLHSFRAVEAIVGEPGSNDGRFRRRLQNAGIDPDELVGYHGEPGATFANRIRWLQRLRDTTSAHGHRRRDQLVTYREAMEAQHLAGALVVRAINHQTSVNGRSDGTLTERRYLLRHMFGGGALAYVRRQLGQTAEVAVRRPGGFERVMQLVTEYRRNIGL